MEERKSMESETIGYGRHAQRRHSIQRTQPQGTTASQTRLVSDSLFTRSRQPVRASPDKPTNSHAQNLAAARGRRKSLEARRPSITMAGPQHLNGSQAFQGTSIEDGVLGSKRSSASRLLTRLRGKTSVVPFAAQTAEDQAPQRHQQQPSQPQPAARNEQAVHGSKPARNVLASYIPSNGATRQAATRAPPSQSTLDPVQRAMQHARATEPSSAESTASTPGKAKPGARARRPNGKAGRSRSRSPRKPTGPSPYKVDPYQLDGTRPQRGRVNPRSSSKPVARVTGYPARTARPSAAEPLATVTPPPAAASTVIASSPHRAADALVRNIFEEGALPSPRSVTSRSVASLAPSDQRGSASSSAASSAASIASDAPMPGALVDADSPTRRVPGRIDPVVLRKLDEAAAAAGVLLIDPHTRQVNSDQVEVFSHLLNSLRGDQTALAAGSRLPSDRAALSPRRLHRLHSPAGSHRHGQSGSAATWTSSPKAAALTMSDSESSTDSESDDSAPRRVRRGLLHRSAGDEGEDDSRRQSGHERREDGRTDRRRKHKHRNGRRHKSSRRGGRRRRRHRVRSDQERYRRMLLQPTEYKGADLSLLELMASLAAHGSKGASELLKTTLDRLPHLRRSRRRRHHRHHRPHRSASVRPPHRKVLDDVAQDLEKAQADAEAAVTQSSSLLFARPAPLSRRHTSSQLRRSPGEGGAHHRRTRRSMSMSNLNLHMIDQLQRQMRRQARALARHERRELRRNRRRSDRSAPPRGRTQQAGDSARMRRHHTTGPVPVRSREGERGRAKAFKDFGSSKGGVEAGGSTRGKKHRTRSQRHRRRKRTGPRRGDTDGTMPSPSPSAVDTGHGPQPSPRTEHSAGPDAAPRLAVSDSVQSTAAFFSFAPTYNAATPALSSRSPRRVSQVVHVHSAGLESEEAEPVFV